jgi:hypothetical protein
MGGTSSSPSTDHTKLCRYIKDIITPYIHLARSQPVQNKFVALHILKGFLEPQDKVPVLRVPALVNLINLSLQSNTKFTLPYIQSIYNMAEMENSCNGIITIRYTGFEKDQDGKYKKITENSKLKPYLFLQTKVTKNKVYIPIDTIKEPKGDGVVYSATHYTQTDQESYSLLHENLLQNSFIIKFLHQYNDTNCKFISIALSLKSTHCGHSNMLLIYKGETSTYLMLYEPHGAEGIQSPNKDIVKQYKEMTDSFIKFLAGVIQCNHRVTRNIRTVKIVEAKKISEPIGIQTYIKDRNGYCSMISSFWLYIILKLVKENKDPKLVEELFKNLNYIEKCLYSIAAAEIKTDQDEEKKSGPVTIPATGAASSSVAVLTVAKQGSLSKYNPDQVLYSIIVHFSFDFLSRFYMDYLKPESKLYNIFVQELKIVYKDKKDSYPVKFNELILARYTDDKRSNVSAEDLDKITSNAMQEIVGLVEDNNPCENHYQCKSTYCKEGKCQSRDYGELQIESEYKASESSQSSVGSDPSQSSDHYKCDATQEIDDDDSYSQDNPEQQPIAVKRRADGEDILDQPEIDDDKVQQKKAKT